MSAEVIPIRARQAASAAPAFSLALALRRLGLVRISPVSWPDGAVSFGFGRFVAVHPEAANPTRLLLGEISRLLGGPRTASPFAEDDRGLTRAGLIAGLVLAADFRVPDPGLVAALAALPIFERERTARLARRIHEAGLDCPRPACGDRLHTDGRLRPRGKPGRSRRAVSATERH